ncbi:MAG: Nif3-like dinuclear metal center hexameric protein [Verrucomicrobiota bacterium]
MKAGEIIEWVAARLGIPAGMIPDGGVIVGAAGTEVHGILVTWMATAEVLRKAADRGCNLVVCHEGFRFEEIPQPPIYRWTAPPAEQPYERPDHPNSVRLRLAEQNNLVVVQIHYGLDRLCICDDFMHQLGITQVIAGGGYEQVYALPVPQTAATLARQVAGKIGLDCVRLVGDSRKMITRVGNLWGGVALSSNRYWMRKQIEYGAEAIICGESDECAEIFAQEYNGTVLIETSHAASENIGLRHFVRMLKDAYPDQPCEFYEVRRPYHFIDAL